MNRRWPAHGASSLGANTSYYRAAEWRHKEIELAAHDLLQLLDRSSA
jgi:hypothetical protein